MCENRSADWLGTQSRPNAELADSGLLALGGDVGLGRLSDHKLPLELSKSPCPENMCHDLRPSIAARRRPEPPNPGFLGPEYGMLASRKEQRGAEELFAGIV